MRLAAMMTVLAMTAAGADRKSEVSTEQTVKVCIGSTIGFNSGPAMGIASQMFQKVDVRVVWLGVNKCPPGALRISFSFETPASQWPGALAYALPYEGTHIVVFWDRLRHTVEEKRTTALLAHVMVHELAHVLQASTRHAREGVMKASWDKADYDEMAWKPLPFDAIDIKLIREGYWQRQLKASTRLVE